MDDNKNEIEAELNVTQSCSFSDHQSTAMNFARDRSTAVITALLARRHIMTLRQPEISPIPCRKEKLRKLDKPVHPRKKMIGDKLLAAVESPNFIFFQYSNVKNADWNDLRFELGKENIKITVFPNKISCKVLQGTRYENLGLLFKSFTAACYSTEDNLQAMLKIMKKFPQLQLMGGKVGDQILSRNQVIEHGKLPPIEVLQAEFLQILLQPAQKLGNLLSQSQRQLCSNLEQYISAQKEEARD